MDIAVTASCWERPHDVRFRETPPGPVDYPPVVDNSLTRTSYLGSTASRPRRYGGRGRWPVAGDRP